MRLKRASLLTKLVITVLLIYMATSLLDLWGQIQSAQSQREELAVQVEQQRLANQELRDAIENSDDPEMLEQVARDLNECGVEAVLSQDIQRDALMKFSVVSPMAACGIYHDVKVAGMQVPGQIREDFKALVGEIGALAEAMGHPFPEDPVARSLAIQDALDPDASTSLKRDLDAGKPSEMDGLIFEVVRLGKKYGVPTPMYSRVAAKLGFRVEEA